MRTALAKNTNATTTTAATRQRSVTPPAAAPLWNKTFIYFLLYKIKIGLDLIFLQQVQSLRVAQFLQHILQVSTGHCAPTTTLQLLARFLLHRQPFWYSRFFPSNHSNHEAASNGRLQATFELSATKKSP